MLPLFLLVSVISFAGSIHPGTVNLAVVQTTISQSRRAGLWLALGGSLPEIGYSALAAGGLMLVSPDSGWQVWLAYASIPVLLGAGLASFRQKPVVLASSAPTRMASPFWKGMALGASNPQLLPFWSAVWLYLSQSMIINVGTPASQWVFSLGTAAGALAFLVAIAWLADRQRQRIIQYLSGTWINRLTGGLFVAMAIWQAIRLLTH